MNEAAISGAGWLEDGFAAYERGDHQSAIKLWLPLARRGDAEAQYNLAVVYADGSVLERDLTAAALWFRRAAEQGDAEAQFNLGVMYRNGDGLLKDVGEAFEWFRRAAHQGHALAQFNLGVAYANGEGTEQNEIEARRLIREAAEKGVAEAQYCLAIMYATAPTPDIVGTYVWMSLAAFGGHQDAATAVDGLPAQMTSQQLREAEFMAKEWRFQIALKSGQDT